MMRAAEGEDLVQPAAIARAFAREWGQLWRLDASQREPDVLLEAFTREEEPTPISGEDIEAAMLRKPGGGSGLYKNLTDLMADRMEQLDQVNV